MPTHSTTLRRKRQYPIILSFENNHRTETGSRKQSNSSDFSCESQCHCSPACTQRKLPQMPVSVSGPLVSIIVPVHNAAASLHRALRSVLSQTLTDYELILVDDCSADESIEMLKKYGELDERVRLFSTSRNSGPGAARNVGLKNARGRYIAFLDADDFWVRNKLELQVRSFEDDKVILSHTRVFLLNTRGDIVGIVNGRKKLHLFDMYVGNRVTMSSAMIRRDLVGGEGMPEIRNREDYAYWISLLQRNDGYITCVPEVLVGYVKMPASVSSNILRNVVDTYRMYVSEVGMSPVQAATLVLVFSCFKFYKEMKARFSWMFLSQYKKTNLRTSIDLYWNWDKQGEWP